MRKRLSAILVVGAVAVGLSIPAGAGAAQSLPEGCEKVKGDVVCFDGPGKNQGGVGETTNFQGNATNDNPDPQIEPNTCRPLTSEAICGDFTP